MQMSLSEHFCTFVPESTVTTYISVCQYMSVQACRPVNCVCAFDAVFFHYR